MNAPVREEVLRLAGVTRTFVAPAGPVSVLRGIDLVVCRGEFVGITGPSGSGKTTLLHLAALLDRPSAGTVRLAGRDMTAASESERCRNRSRRIGMVFQDARLLSHRSALANVAFRFRYVPEARGEATPRAAEALAAVGLGPVSDRTARLLSGGERQRVAIARAVALPPLLLLADEPTGNLDRDAARAVMAAFERLRCSGIAIVLATHNEALLAACSARHVLRDGRLERAA